MNPALSPSFALCYPSLHHPGRGLSFPCDECGSIDLDRLPERARNNYFAARALLGRDYAHPQIELTMSADLELSMPATAAAA